MSEEERRTGAIVALIPAEDDPIHRVGPVEAHITLAWLGDAVNITDTLASLMEEQLEELSASSIPITANVVGWGYLGEDLARVLHLEGEHLRSFHAQVIGEGTAVDRARSAVEQYPEWLPHLTIGYPAEPVERPDLVGETILFDRLALWVGENRVTYPLGRDS